MADWLTLFQQQILMANNMSANARQSSMPHAMQILDTIYQFAILLLSFGASFVAYKVIGILKYRFTLELYL